ncbi:MAG: flagellar basal body rod protein FlgB [Thermodesulfobacteriota bacterium]
MATNGIFDTTIQALDKVLDLRTQKLKTISSNIANAETPGYSRLKMDFEQQLKDAVSGSENGASVTHPRHMPAASANRIADVEGHIYRQEDQGGIGDRNSVSLEQEMVELSENQIRYESATRMLSKKFNMLKFVIQGRG